MIIDNLNVIKKYIVPNPDYYWFLQIIARRKDNSDLPRCEKYIKDYYIQTPEQLDQLKNEIVELSKFFNARVYFHPTARSFRKMAIASMHEISKRLLSDEYKVHRLSRTISGGKEALVPGTKYWMIDIATSNYDGVATTIKIVEDCPPNIGVCDIIPTINGYHLITKPFDCLKYSQSFKDMQPPEIHKNSPVLAYYNGIRK